jgi:hypothetical protein
MMGALELAVAMWVMVAPLDMPGVWGWKIIDGPFPTKQACEERQAARLDREGTYCARIDKR